MPQMAPLLWFKLYIFFVLIFMLFIVCNFFIKTPGKMAVPYSPAPVPSYQWKW